MKKTIVLLSLSVAVCCFTACGGKKAESAPEDADENANWITLFDGQTLNGWRGYNRPDVPAAWTIEDNSLKIQGSGRGEAGAANGGDLIFDRKFKNFELELEWKVSKGANSGIFYLAQEVEGQPIYVSAPECQVLDNENHPDAKLGKDGNRMSSSLYDMIPASPQNAKPFGEWNKVRILSYNGTIAHFQNDVQVLEYHLWTEQWNNLLNESKFKQGSKDFPLAFDLLSNCGGEAHEGFIGLQDHGDDVWFRNIRIKLSE